MFRDICVIYSGLRKEDVIVNSDMYIYNMLMYGGKWRGRLPKACQLITNHPTFCC